MKLDPPTAWQLECVGIAALPANEMSALCHAPPFHALCAKGWPVAVEQKEEGHRSYYLPAVAGQVPPALMLKELSFGEAGHGHKVWECGIALAIWLALHPELVRGRRILELGSGLGICGISASIIARGQCALTLTDLDGDNVDETIWLEGSAPVIGGDLLGNLKANAAANQVDAQTAALDWHKCLEPSFEPHGMYDLVVASDCIYASADAAALAATIRAHLAPGGTALLMNRMGRAGSQELLEELSVGSWCGLGDQTVQVEHMRITSQPQGGCNPKAVATGLELLRMS